MKIEADREQFADAVAWAARVLPPRPTTPVLSGMKIEAATNLAISAYDYEVSAQAEVQAAVGEPGTVLVSGKLLAEIVKSLPAKPVSIDVDEARMTVKCGSAEFILMLLPAEEFPSLPGMPPAVGSIGADTFATAVAQVSAAVGKDDTLPALTGIRTEIAGDAIRMIATDRYRLAVRTLPWTPAAPGLETDLLIPARVLADTARALTSGAEVDVALDSEAAHGDGIVGFSGPGRSATTRLLAGEYPRIQQLLPDTFSSAALIETGPFAEAVKRVALVAERNTPIRLTFSSGEVLLEAGTGDEAQATEAMPAQFEGEELRIAFNPQFLVDGLAAIGSDTARVSFTTPTRPAVITAASDEDSPDYRYVLMPIRSAG